LMTATIASEELAVIKEATAKDAPNSKRLAGTSPPNRKARSSTSST
jgi:hypothetical protein